MNTIPIDWIIAGIILTLIIVGGYASKFLVKNVADWTVAGRNLRKFLLISSGSAEGIGLLSIALSMEVGFSSGLSYFGIFLLVSICSMVLYGIAGFVINRFRKTEAVTVPEYTDRRFSKGVRILCGGVIAFAGILNLAIFPIMASNFLIHFLNAPQHMEVLGLQLPFVPLLMAGLMGLALFFAYTGGMVSVIFTNYIMAIIINGVIFIITWLAIKDVGFEAIHKTLTTNFGEGGFNPLLSDNFGPLFIIWAILGSILNFPSFAPTMQKIASTDNARTARQMTLLGTLFGPGRVLAITLWGVVALTVLGPVASGGIDAGLYTKVAGAKYLGQLIPPVIFGFALAGMVSAFISTVDSYILTWSTVLVNDVISPFLKKPLTAKKHIGLLRMCVALIAILIYLFGIFYDNKESLLEFIMLTGTMMYGAGISIIGGLYWKRASTAGAYGAVIFCGLIPVVSMVLRRISENGEALKAQYFGLGAIILASLVFVLLSVIIPDKNRRKESLV